MFSYFEVGPRTGTNVLVISVIYRVCTNPEVKMVMPKGGGLDPGGRADLISPNLLLGFAARCLLHNLYKISLQLALFFHTAFYTIGLISLNEYILH